MCSVFGALIWDVEARDIESVNKTINHIANRSKQRGRDGQGAIARQTSTTVDMPVLPDFTYNWAQADTEIECFDFFLKIDTPSGIVIGNFRAEPTTEYVKEKHDSDQQPYHLNGWSIVHNGTIANDAELRDHTLPTKIDSAAIVELLGRPGIVLDNESSIIDHFIRCIKQLKGSYAILAIHKDYPTIVMAACNYRPIWFARSPNGVFFASACDYFPFEMVPEMLAPYSIAIFTPNNMEIESLRAPHIGTRRALVICSGGLDSVVAASAMRDRGWYIELLHFQYGSRAQRPELKAVQAVAAALHARLNLFALPIYRPEDSPLLRSDSAIAGGEAGAEFAHEWVPARNLVMLAIATAIAEAQGFDAIVLGNNLEEAGAYPDNEPEFINRFNDLLPFAVADGKKVEVIMPVGHLMKHEIVELGHMLDAPLHLTWSCYRAGEKHCGTCGPCFMRRTAFAINDRPEVISYANEEDK